MTLQDFLERSADRGQKNSLLAGARIVVGSHPALACGAHERGARRPA